MSAPPPGKHRIPLSVLGYTIHRYARLASTNEAAKQIAKQGGKERTVIIAETQTRGKGRLGRQWVSPKGGIWLSILLRPEIDAKATARLTFVAATAVASTIHDTLGLEPEIKWPNDILIRRRKVCGILTETAARGDTIDFAILGVGINANTDLGAFPEGLQSAVTSLQNELGHSVDREALLQDFLRNFEQRYRCLLQRSWSPLLQEWKSFAKFLGERVAIDSIGEVFEGEAVDVDDAGALIVRLDNGALRKVVAGDVRLKIPDD